MPTLKFRSFLFLKLVLKYAIIWTANELIEEDGVTRPKVFYIFFGCSFLAAWIFPVVMIGWRFFNHLPLTLPLFVNDLGESALIVGLLGAPIAWIISISPQLELPKVEASPSREDFIKMKPSGQVQYMIEFWFRNMSMGGPEGTREDDEVIEALARVRNQFLYREGEECAHANEQKTLMSCRSACNLASEDWS